MKTRKYTVETECCENAMLWQMEISKKEFDRQLKLMRNQVIVSSGYESPVIEPERSGKVFDHPTYTETIFVFQTACSVTYLTRLETKEGYKFTH